MSNNTPTPTIEFEEVDTTADDGFDEFAEQVAEIVAEEAMHSFVFKQREYAMPLAQYRAALQMFSGGNPAMESFAQGIVHQAWAMAHAPTTIKKARQQELADLARRASEDFGVKAALAGYFAAVQGLQWAGATPKFNDVSVFYSWNKDIAPTLADIINRTGGDGTINLTKDDETGDVRVSVRMDTNKSAALRRVRDDANINIAAAIRQVVTVPNDVFVSVADDFKSVEFSESAVKKSSGTKSASGALPARVIVKRIADGKIYDGTPQAVCDAMKADGHVQAGFCPAYVVNPKRLAQSKYAIEIPAA